MNKNLRKVVVVISEVIDAILGAGLNTATIEVREQYYRDFYRTSR